jgi:hypothetical protein
MSTLRLLSVAALCVLLGAVRALAQDSTPPGDTPAHLSYVEGSVDLVHEGVTERADGQAMLLEGDLVRTGNGRAEIVFGDGTLLHLDHDGELEVLAPTRVRLSRGRISVRVSPAAGDSYVIDTPGGSVSLDARGEFGVVADRHGRLDVSVARGTAEIDDGSQRVIVRAGEMVTLAQPGARADYRAFNSARWDNFAQWAHDRAQGSTASPSASRLPSELRVYSDVLDHHGRWEYASPYGFVWYPTVAVGWRPYFDGRWAHTRYGWTWHGRDRWAWPTHHYGRWGFNGVSWFWIPLRGWGPAWVSWGYAPGFVSWAPLGWDGGPAIGLWPRRDHPAYWPHDPWRGWTVVPRDRFGGRVGVRSAAIDGRLIDDTTRRAMIIRHGGPEITGSAVPRGSISVAGASGTNRRVEPSRDVPGSVRRPPAAVGPAGVPGRRVTDAPAYAPAYTPDENTGARVRTRGADERDGSARTDDAGARPGGIRYANPRTGTRGGDSERPVVTGPGDRGERTEGARERGSDRPRGEGAGTGAASGGGTGAGRDGGSRPGGVRAGPRGDGPRTSGPTAGAPDSGRGGGARSRGGAGSGSAAGSGGGRGSGGASRGGAVPRGASRPR